MYPGNAFSNILVCTAPSAKQLNLNFFILNSSAKHSVNVINAPLLELYEDRPGNFTELLEWLKINVHSKASFYSTNDILEQVTNSKLNAKYFEDYIKNRYL